MHFGNADGNVLSLYPGAVMQGAVVGGTGTDTLKLGPSFPASGIIPGPVTGFERIDVADRGKWLLAGSDTIGGSIDFGTISGTLKIGGTLIVPTNLTGSGTGTLAVADGGRIEVGNAGKLAPASSSSMPVTR